MGVWFCTRESVKSALDEAETARSNDQIDEAIEQGARDVEGLLELPNLIAPTLATKTFDYPSRNSLQPSWRLRFGYVPLLSASSVTTRGGAATLTAGQYKLRPAAGPPYYSLEIDLSGSGALDAAGTHQDAIGVTGLWGLENVRKSVGSLSTTLGASTAATASLAWTTARFGVGSVLFVDSEAMFVAERSFVDSTQNLAADLAAQHSATSVTVADGAGFALEEIISVGGERMRVVDIIGNTLVVKRAWDGSQLAAHSSGADIYALTGVELERAQLGTTLAAHNSAAAVYIWRPPGLCAALNRAYALNTLLQERAGYARVAGTGEAAREYTGRGVAQLEADALRRYPVPPRVRAIL